METPTPTSRPASYGWVFVVTLLLALAVAGGGGYLAYARQEYTLLGVGLLGIIASLLTLPLAAIASRTSGTGRMLDTRLAPILTKFDAILAQLTLISEQQLISDRAKQIAFREKDRDAFRRAIQEDLTKADYDAAIALVDEMQTEFGSRGEVERMRSEITNRRDDAIRRQLDSAISVVDRLADSEQWQAAFKEAERLKTIYPDQVRIQMLSGDVEQRRQAVKRTLLARWSEHVKGKQIDDAIFVLRKLDTYLTPVEAAGLEEDARMVFKEKLAKLRVDFTGAVQSHNWRDAKKLADLIISDFPNTQMAKEVRDMLPTLDERLHALNAAGSLHPIAT